MYNTCLSNRSSCFKPRNTVIRCRRPRTQSSATSTFWATRSRLCLFCPCTTEKHVASFITCFRPGDLMLFLFTVCSILLNVSVFHPFRTSTMSSITTAKGDVRRRCKNTTRYGGSRRSKADARATLSKQSYLNTQNTTLVTGANKLNMSNF